MPKIPEPRQPTRLAYSVTEVARMLGMSRQSVYAAIYRGDLPYRTIGARKLIPAEAVEEFGRVPT